MFGLVVWQGVRNARGQIRLVRQIDTLQNRLSHTHIRFETGATVFASETPTKLRIPATMAEVFAANGTAEFNVYYQNVGMTNSERTGAVGDVLVTDTMPNLDIAFENLSLRFKSGWTGDVLVPQDRMFFTANSRGLSDADIRKLNLGNSRLFLIAMVRFSDSTGDYQQEFCGWLQLPLLSTQLIWHGCGVHGSEKPVTGRR